MDKSHKIHPFKFCTFSMEFRHPFLKWFQCTIQIISNENLNISHCFFLYGRPTKNTKEKWILLSKEDTDLQFRHRISDHIQSYI